MAKTSLFPFFLFTKVYKGELRSIIKMKAITNKEKLPKFLVVNGEPESTPYNKHLLKPWKKGEVVKVVSFEEQVPNRKHQDMFKYTEPMSDEDFRKRYVKVIRKDDEGKWSLVYTEGWKSFDLLTNKKQK